MPGRIIVKQPDVAGGLSTSTDIFKDKPSQWVGGLNAITCRPLPTAALYSADVGCVTSGPVISCMASPTNSSGPNHARISIATFETAMWPTEVWTGGASSPTINDVTTGAYGEGNQSRGLTPVNPGDTASMYGTVASKDLSTYVNGTGGRLASEWFLKMDAQCTTPLNFLSGFVRLGSDASNYIELALNAPTSATFQYLTTTTLNNATTTGTPVLTALDYVYISITAKPATLMAIVFDDLRLETNSTDILVWGSNVTSAYVYDYLSQRSGLKLVTANADVVSFIPSTGMNGTAQYTAQCKIKTGLTHIPINYTFPKNTDGKSGNRVFGCSFTKVSDPSKNIFCFANGQDGVFTYDANAGVGSRLGTILTNSTREVWKYVCVHKNMLFMAGNPARPDSIAVSGVNDYTTFDIAHEITLDPYPGSDVTGMVSMDDYLVIMRDKDMYVLYGSSPESTASDAFSLKRTKARVGCVSQSAACRVGPFLYIYDGNDIFKFGGFAYEGTQAQSITGGKILDKISAIYSYTKRSVWMTYLPERNALMLHFPGSNGDPFHYVPYGYTIVVNLDNGSCGIFGSDADPSSATMCSAVVPYDNNYTGTGPTSNWTYLGGLGNYRMDSLEVGAWYPVSRSTMIQTMPNFCGSPGIVKDYDKFVLYIRDMVGLTTPANVRLDFYSDTDISTIRQTVTATPVNGKITTLLTGVAGDCLSCKITVPAFVCSAYNAVRISGYDFSYSQMEEF